MNMPMHIMTNPAQVAMLGRSDAIALRSAPLLRGAFVHQRSLAVLHSSGRHNRSLNLTGRRKPGHLSAWNTFDAPRQSAWKQTATKDRRHRALALARLGGAGNVGALDCPCDLNQQAALS